MWQKWEFDKSENTRLGAAKKCFSFFNKDVSFLIFSFITFYFDAHGNK